MIKLTIPRIEKNDMSSSFDVIAFATLPLEILVILEWRGLKGRGGIPAKAEE